MPGLIHNSPLSQTEEAASQGSRTRLVVGCLNDEAIDNAMRFIDVMDGTIAQAAHCGVVFFTSNVIVRLVQQLESAMIAPRVSHMSVDRRMIIQILAIINRSVLDLCNGFVNLLDGTLLFVVHSLGGSRALQMGAGVPQVGERVQISGMPSRFVRKGKSGACGNNKQNQSAISQSLHSLLFHDFL
jgi:hypothetical protein